MQLYPCTRHRRESIAGVNAKKKYFPPYTDSNSQFKQVLDENFSQLQNVELNLLRAERNGK